MTLAERLINQLTGKTYPLDELAQATSSTAAEIEAALASLGKRVVCRTEGDVMVWTAVVKTEVDARQGRMF